MAREKTHITPVYLTHSTLISAMGEGIAAHLQGLFQEKTSLTPCDFEDVALPCAIGRVRGIEEETIPALYNTRIHRLCQRALKQDNFEEAVQKAIERYGRQRVGLIIGTSTSGILTTEHAYFARDKHGKLPESFSFRHANDHYAINTFLQEYFQLEGVSYAVSTACSSSARVFIDAHQLISSGLCDAVIVGGADSLCLTTLYGFNSLELLSPVACTPCDQHRKGISIGEAAAFTIIEREPHKQGNINVALLGYGESSDGYHMSSPHPEGRGAILAVTDALARAGIPASAIDYINLHGTGTLVNDSMEDKVISTVFGQTPCSSTKGWTGHTLGAAGMVEAIFSSLCILHNFMPKGLGITQLDPQFRSQVLQVTRRQPVKKVLSNSFGFGGNNCSLIFGGA